VSRLAPEKNIDFLCAATARYLSKNEKAHFLIVGKGPSKKRMCELFEQAGVRHRVHFTGALQGDDVADAYHAMHLFVFGSHTETQGIVLAEAMAAGVPVAAVDAPGVREVVHDNRNGKLIPNDDENHMADAIAWFQRRSHVEKTRYSHHAKETARAFSVDRCVESALSIYTTVMPRHRDSETHHNSFWNETLRRIHAEWELLSNATKATGAALRNHKS
jgi:glycosyltransferase involved in cell wall biosynthesis